MTVEKTACGGARELLEGLVLLETGGEVLGGLRIEIVIGETASGGEIRVETASEASKGARKNAST